jgi:hypothetical protein
VDKLRLEIFTWSGVAAQKQHRFSAMNEKQMQRKSLNHRFKVEQRSIENI